MTAPATLDFTKGQYTEFSGSTADDISYAKTFWQSIQLQPPVESRLVSSDIKQRLKVAPSGSHSMSMAHMIPDQPKALQEFMIRAKTLERLEEYRVLQRYAHAREQDLELLNKRKAERKKKEEISKGRGLPKLYTREAFIRTESDEESNFVDENAEDTLKQIDDFEKSKFGSQDSDSD
ncbi:hypothetical protein FSP39_004723 [Pinctada imbricata]|uniref:Cilia- and flagella-associated protein HOATZ n=1 Tax=Pinctada imbricata TaxID=66713 RepID=A0AA88YVI4_PINIB|nr:hypothetical protein FSP39_004723 [Pinctada imbricata]